MAVPRSEAVPVADDSRAVLTAWRRLLQAVRRRERLAERDAGLTGAQLFALRQLDEHPGATVGQLAALTVTDASSTSVLVTRLLEKGCVRRERDPVDQRRWRLQLTAEGAGRLAKAPDSADQRLTTALAAITKGERETLAAHLHSLARAVELVPSANAPQVGSGWPRRPRGNADPTDGATEMVASREPTIHT